jgi:hypothetical protein
MYTADIRRLDGRGLDACPLSVLFFVDKSLAKYGFLTVSRKEHLKNPTFKREG